MRFLPYRFLVRSSGLVIFLAGCGGTALVSDSPQTQPDAQGQTDSQPQGDPQPDARVLPVPDPICPGTLPSGTCVSDSLHCMYDDAMGCPVIAVCMSFGGADLYWDTLMPPPVGTCSTPGKICEYETGREGVPQRQALRCGDSLKWEQHDLCPAETPAAGASCDHPNLHCDYGHCPGNGIPVASAQCMGSQGDGQAAVWSVKTFCSPADGG